MTYATTEVSLADRIHALDWEGLRSQLDTRGFAVTAPVLDEGECHDLAELFDGGRFRSTIDMARHRFGRYFDHPLPEEIEALRTSFYGHLAPIANDWSSLLGDDSQAFPLEHEELLVGFRHGVSTLTSGSRTALGVIFHDAK